MTQLIKELRVRTGAPMIECKKALSAVKDETEGELLLDKAMQWLRTNGSAKITSKLSGRDADEGLVAFQISSDKKSASLVKIGSETDFASRSDVFVSFVQNVADAALVFHSSNSNQSSVVQFNESDFTSQDSDFWKTNISSESSETKTVKEALDDAILSIRENLQLKQIYSIICSPKDEIVLSGYVHGKTSPASNAGTSAAVVELIVKDSDKSTADIEDLGKKLAMHIVASKPKFLSPSDIPQDILDKEKSILMEQMAADPKNNSKPPEILEKIVGGRINKFYQEVCLLEQSHMVEEGNPKIKTLLQKNGLELRSYQSVYI